MDVREPPNKVGRSTADAVGRLWMRSVDCGCGRSTADAVGRLRMRSVDCGCGRLTTNVVAPERSVGRLVERLELVEDRLAVHTGQHLAVRAVVDPFGSATAVLNCRLGDGSPAVGTDGEEHS